MLQPLRGHDQHRAGAGLESFIFVDRQMKRPLEDMMDLDHLDRRDDEPNAFSDLTDGEGFDLYRNRSKERIDRRFRTVDAA